MSTSYNKRAESVIRNFGARRFSTYEFIEAFRARFPETWQRIVVQYREGFRMGKLLRSKANRGELINLNYEDGTPDGWHDPLVPCWVATSAAHDTRVSAHRYSCPVSP